MAQGPMESALMSGDPMDKLTDDILVDIISRVPYKSTCCCKCVSTRWCGLFSHPDHRKKLPQPLAGFFHEGYDIKRSPTTPRYFTNVSGEGEPLVDPLLSFLPKYEKVDILDCCNGLLLCLCWKPTGPETLDYVVCNPATEIWVVVPANHYISKVSFARLGFEPMVSSHFHVFEFWFKDESELDEWDGSIEALAIYSSKARVWKHQSMDDTAVAISTKSKGAFLNGILHLVALEDVIVAVDVERNDWWHIDIPMPTHYGRGLGHAIFVSRGQLYFTNNAAGSDGCEQSIWALEDYVSEKWTLKHNVSHLDLFGARYSAFANDYKVISFHPERNMIFIVCGRENTLMSYDMDRRKLCFLCQLGWDFEIQCGETSYLPYVTLFSEALADE